MSLNFDFGIPVSIWQQPFGTKQCMGCNRYIKLGEDGNIIPHKYTAIRVGPGPGKYSFQPPWYGEPITCDFGKE